MGNKLIKALREVSPRSAVRIGISHAFLLVGCIWGGLPYIFLQLLLVAELFLLTLASIPLYPERGVLSHTLDVLKLSGGLVFVSIFILVGYVVAREGDSKAMVASLMGLRDIGLSDAAWALGFVVLRLSISMHVALRSTNPRGSWTKSTLTEGGATFVALFFMVFVSLFVGKPIVMALAGLGLKIDVDALLSALMVIVRYLLALVLSTMSDSEMDSIAQNPYIER